MTRDLSIVIPAFQEESRLPKTLSALDDFVAAGTSDVEVVLVDDGSEDATPEIMSAWCDGRPFARSLSLLHGGKAHAVKKRDHGRSPESRALHGRRPGRSTRGNP